MRRDASAGWSAAELGEVTIHERECAPGRTFHQDNYRPAAA